MSQRTHLVSCFIKQFSRERTCSYASTICFEDTVNFSDTVGSYAQSGAGTGTNCIGRSNKRIRTEVDIKHSTLCTFTKNTLSVLQQIVYFMFAIYKMELFQIFDTFQPCLFQFSKIIFVVQAFQDLFVTSLCSSVFLIEIMKDITYTDTVTAYFIRICRTDPLTGSSHFGSSFGSFVSSVQDTVCRKNEMRFL